MNKLESSSVIQIGLIVKDVEKTAKAYAEMFGLPVPEIRLTGEDEFAQTRYHGLGSSATAKLAFFELGQVQMELIEPIGSPSTWAEFLNAHGQGLHHMAFKTEDMALTQQFLASKGLETIQQGGWDGGQYAYVDGSEKLGAILELLHFDKK